MEEAVASVLQSPFKRLWQSSSLSEEEGKNKANGHLYSRVPFKRTGDGIIVLGFIGAYVMGVISPVLLLAIVPVRLLKSYRYDTITVLGLRGAL